MAVRSKAKNASDTKSNSQVYCLQVHYSFFFHDYADRNYAIHGKSAEPAGADFYVSDDPCGSRYS